MNKEKLEHRYEVLKEENEFLKEMDNLIETLKQENNFLRERENKLQKIEQMFKSGSVNLSELAELVEEK